MFVKKMGSSSSGSSGTNRSADVSNIICLTACVFGLKKKKRRVGGGAQPPPRGGWLGGGGAPLQTFNIYRLLAIGRIRIKTLHRDPQP